MCGFAFASLVILAQASGGIHGRMALLAYDLAPDGSAKFRRTVVDFSPGVGPDGISVDRDGNIYCAIPGRATGRSCLRAGPEGAGLYRDARPPDQCEVRPGSGYADVVHYGAEESVSDSRGAQRVPPWLLTPQATPNP